MERPQRQRTRLHDEPALANAILSTIQAPVPLAIKESTIPGAGSGLFAAGDIPAGEEIFRSQPFVNCCDAGTAHICGYCFANAQSGVRLNGRFLTAGEEMPRMRACSGCRVARYCSTACQKKAWARFHKFECPILKETPVMPTEQLVLYRLLLLDHAGRISPQQWEVITRLEPAFVKHDESSNGEAIMHMAMEVGQRIEGLKRDLSFVWNLCCIILTNSMSVHPAEKEVSHGCSLDLAVSMINHSCAPNALVFFEGTQVRVRSLHAIRAGGEILVSYIDPRLDVLARREVLRVHHFIDCNCGTCARELEDLRCAYLGGSEARVAALLRAEKRLATTIRAAADRFFKTYTGGEASQVDPKVGILAEFVAEAREIIKNSPFDSGEWPEHVEPLPLMRMTLATMHMSTGQVARALHCALRGCLSSRRSQGKRLGFAWVADLFDVCRVLVRISVQPADSFALTAKEASGPTTFPSREQIRLLTCGYLQEACIAVRKTFGGDTKYTKAVMTYATPFRQVPGQPGPQTAEFAERFAEAQVKMLNWAGVDTACGIVVSGPDDIGALEEALKGLGAAEKK